jgi:glycosyltransferase involved in cell wall biosynthesis
MSIPGNNENIYVVIPSYNEQTVIRPVVEGLLSYGYEVIVVDDGSEAPAAKVLAGLPVYSLQHEVNLGQGAAIQTGIEFALSMDANYVITFDADGQHHAENIEELLQPLREDRCDIVLGSRFLEGSVHNMPAKRKLLLQFGRRLNYLFTGLFLTDAHNGLRAMNRKAATAIRITENRMAHATEILSLIRKNRLRYLELPVKVTYSEYSKKKGQALGSSFRIVFDLLLNKLFR